MNVIPEILWQGYDLGHQVGAGAGDLAYWTAPGGGHVMVVYGLPELAAFAGLGIHEEIDLQISPGCLLSPDHKAYFVLDIEARGPGGLGARLRLAFDAKIHLDTLPRLVEVARGRAVLILTADRRRRALDMIEVHQVGALATAWLPDETEELLGWAGYAAQVGAELQGAMN